MALSVKSADADRLARELAATTGETLTEAVVVSLRERLEREQLHRSQGKARRLRRLAVAARDLPVLDPRGPETIVDYDERGLPA